MINWEHIRELSKMNTPEDIQEFEQELSEISSKKDLNTLSNLIELFDDRCPHYEVMYSLVHAVETYPIYDYVITVLKKLSYLVEKCPFWADCLFNRIFNDERYLVFFRSNMGLASKEDLLKLFDLMDQESPHHKTLTSALRKEIIKGYQ